MTEEIQNKNTLKETDQNTFSKYNIISILVVLISIVTLLVIAGDECRTCFQKLSNHTQNTRELKKFWIYGKNVESGYLHNVLTILDNLGYVQTENTDWELLWAHDYPFRKMWPQLKNLKAYQKVNHFPGCGYITNKVDLATSGLPFIPVAFKLPDHKEKLLEYVRQYPNKTFVQKNNDHRNIKVKQIDTVDLDKDGTFIQEFVDRPLLVNGHKFDIGIYTVITSIDPLRVYIYNGDVLFRFCPVKYYPFDPGNLDQYVVGDDYLPIWEMPAFDYYYNQLGFGMRDSFNSHMKAIGKNPHKIWEQIEEAIRVVILEKEQNLVQVTNKFASKRNFFELMRFDFVVDEDFNVYLLEANMSPNLSSAHFPPNQLLYHQLLYNVMGLLGLGRRANVSDLLISYKNIATFSKECNSQLCRSSCVGAVCQLCRHCIGFESEEYLKEAYREFVDRGDCKRIFPPSFDQNQELPDLDNYSPENQLQIRWFYGKCLMDKSWC